MAFANVDFEQRIRVVIAIIINIRYPRITSSPSQKTVQFVGVVFINVCVPSLVDIGSTVDASKNPVNQNVQYVDKHYQISPCAHARPKLLIYPNY